MTEYSGKAAPGRAVVLSVADVAALDFSGLDPAEAAVAAQAAMDAWGLAGVGVRRDSHWAAVALIAPALAISRHHPLSACGIEQGTAGLTLFHVDDGPSALAIGKRLGVELCRRLRGQVGAIEAQGCVVGASALAPSVVWLRHLGFHPVRYPPGRHRLDLDNLETWLAKVRGRLRTMALPHPLPANRSAR